MNYAIMSAEADLLVQDQGNYLTGSAKLQSFREALMRYSRDMPRHAVEDFTGDGAAYQFAFTGPFSPGLSQVVRVEYPAGMRPARYLSVDGYTVYQVDADTPVLSLPYLTPGSSETVRVSYTALHTIENMEGADATTIPGWHEPAVIMLAASRMLARLAARFIHEQDSTIDADAINRNSKDESAAKRSRALESDYHSLLGIKRGVAPGVVTIDWDTSFAGSGMDYLTHPARRR